MENDGQLILLFLMATILCGFAANKMNLGAWKGAIYATVLTSCSFILAPEFFPENAKMPFLLPLVAAIILSLVLKIPAKSAAIMFLLCMFAELVSIAYSGPA